MKNLPDFLIIGAARAGTTALYRYLRQSPQIFMPDVKETNFFAYKDRALTIEGPGADFINNSVTRLEAYQALFAAAPDGAIRGEASPLYLFEPGTAETIRAIVPDVKLVCILRNPIDQAFSHFLYATKLRVETLPDFTEALMREDERLAKNWQPLFGYSRFARFGTQLERFLAVFPREQMLLLTYDRYEAEPEAVMAEILAFVGADPAFVPDMSKRANAGGVPKNKAFQDFIMKPNPITGLVALMLPLALRRAIRDRLAALNTRTDKTMPPRARAILTERLTPEIRKIEQILGQDLGHWLR
ncbi:MAG: sulfotransferase [Roseivivax sp.]|nr:sulfotransferase [Roseivivax sp.]